MTRSAASRVPPASENSGIEARGGCNTACAHLAAAAAVLAELLAVDPITATRWAKYSKRDWLGYVAERDAAQHSPSLSHKLAQAGSVMMVA
ncbi:MAG: hypothetical protein WA944_16515 [Mycobacterium sp.]